MLKNRKIRGILGLLLIWTLIVPTYYQAFAGNSEQEALKEQLAPAKVIAHSKGKAKKEKEPAVSKLLEFAKAAEVKPQEYSTYIVRLEAPAVPEYKGGIQDLKPTSPLVTKQKKLDVNKAESQAYMKYLDLERETVVKKVNQAIGRQPKIVHEYRLAMNGFAAQLTLDEAVAVAELPDVSWVIPEWTEYIQTDAGPAWMGADTIWNGSATGTSTKGEGIVVGIVDTGINMDHPSFADIGGDGYDHNNPFGTGDYFGWCNPSDPNYDPTLPCNDKLIGVWSGDTDAYGPRDCDGHGSHTASTVAGNVVTNVVINAPTIAHPLANQISGVAPHANIIAYNIEGTPCTGSAPSSSIIAATEQAIADQVDVINYSFGGGSSDPWASAEHWYNVRAAGIFVATSAGNNGSASDTIGSPGNSPWMMTVGASSHNRMFSNVLQNMTGGGTPPADIQGEGVTDGLPLTPIVYAGAIDPLNEGCDGTYAPGTFSGEIVVCDYNSTGYDYIGRVNKSLNVAGGGGGGFILITREDWGVAVMVDSYAVPGMGIPYEDGQILKDWLASGTGHQAAIRGVQEEPAPGDIMAGFSSRGPNGPLLDVIKPDVTAPGRRIVAAIATDQSAPNPPEFDVYQGTSMSSPHAAGAAALIRALHPTWTPAEVQSALMTTANYTTTLKEDGITPADAFDMGAGRIDLLAAAKAPLVLDETPENLWAADPAAGGDPTTLNLASLSNSRCVGYCTWSRMVKSTTAATWNASVSAPAGSALTVTPSTFSLAPGATQELTITMDVMGMPLDEWVFGTVVLTPTDTGLPATHLPVAVMPSSGSVPDQMTIRTRRNAGSQIIEDVEAIEITDLTIEVDGMIPATVVTQNIDQDSDNDSPYDNPSDGAFYVTVSVPSGAPLLVAEILESEAPDIDMFVGTGVAPDAATEVCASTSPSWEESCSIANPEAGDWWILVQNWEASDTPPDSVTLSYGVIEDADTDNMTVSGPTSVSAGDLFDLTVFWDEPTMVAGERWYGVFSIGTDGSNPGNVGSVFVVLERLEDDVAKTVDSPVAKPGDTLTYQITIQPNVTPTDLVYTLTDTIPEGLTYVPGSATATAGTVEVTGNTLSWTGTMSSPIGLIGNYVVTTNATDPACDTPFLGYVDLESRGFVADPGITGDTTVWTAFTGGDPFSFYGVGYDGMSFSDDGFATFDPANNYGGEPWTPQSIPDAAQPNNVLAMYWHDFEIFYDAAQNHGVTLVDIINQEGVPVGAVVEYDDIQPYGGGAPVMDFEIFVYKQVDDTPGEYEIFFAYDNINSTPAPATIGVENAAGTSATDLVNNGDATGVISNGLVVCFDYQGPTLDPVVITYQVTVDEEASGTLTNTVVHNTDNPGSQEVEICFDVEVSDHGCPVTPTSGPGVIPEPASFVLFGLGLLGLIGFLARRKRR